MGSGGYIFWNFFEKKNLGEVLDPFQLPIDRNLKHPQKMVFQNESYVQVGAVFA